MLLRISAIFIWGLGSVTMLFFNHYHGELIPYPWVGYVAGFVMWIIGFYLWGYARSAPNRAARRKMRRLAAYLSANGEQIPVDLTACEIRGNDWDETIEIPHYDRPNDYVKVDVEQSVFIFKCENPHSGAQEKFVSPVIPKNKISLAFRLEAQRQTTLYVDKADRSSYFFDLDFLGD